MSGIGKSINYIANSGKSFIDGLLGGKAWDGAVTYAFPDSFNAYGDYPNASGLASEQNGFDPLTTNARQSAIRMMNDEGISGAFSVEGLTNVIVQAGADTNAHIRLAYTAMESSSAIYYGYSWLPETDGGWGSYYAARAGDVWLNSKYNQQLEPGNRAWYVTMHEIGHGFGLKHPHDSTPEMPSRYDNMSNTVMSYEAYSGSGNSFHNAAIDYPQTYMRSDIAALQHMYGADYSTNSSNTVYKWQPGNGNTLINGKVAIAPEDNRIFLTIWDGGGTDTYDLSAYGSRLKVDLRAGLSSKFGDDQIANLGDGHSADGMVYNAYLHNGDRRSLIENAVGGMAGDRITGNVDDNDLRGRGGMDQLLGLAGADTLRGGAGRDKLFGGAGDDLLIGNKGADLFRGGPGSDLVSFLSSATGVTVNLREGRGRGGDAQGDRYVAIEDITGSQRHDVLTGNTRANEIAGRGGWDIITGQGGDDTLSGGGGNDVFVFGKGRTHHDTITDFGFGGVDDRIKMSGFGRYENYGQVRNNMTQADDGVHISARDGDLIVIVNTVLADLDRDVFLFA